MHERSFKNTDIFKKLDVGYFQQNKVFNYQSKCQSKNLFFIHFVNNDTSKKKSQVTKSLTSNLQYVRVEIMHI